MMSTRQTARIDSLRKVLEHIEQKLDDPLDLRSLADLASTSPFHFHRMFRKHMGESIGAYVRRRRLAVAAAHLAYMPTTPILQIALRVGFGSAESFARAFKRQIGATPSEWRDIHLPLDRQEGKSDQTKSNFDQAAMSRSGDDSRALESRLRPRPDVRVVRRKSVSVA